MIAYQKLDRTLLTTLDDESTGKWALLLLLLATSYLGTLAWVEALGLRIGRPNWDLSLGWVVGRQLENKAMNDIHQQTAKQVLLLLLLLCLTFRA